MINPIFYDKFTIALLFVMILPVIIVLCNKKERIKYKRNLKKSKLNTLEFLIKESYRWIRLLPNRVINDGIKSYGEYKDILVHIVINGFVIMTLLKVISNMGRSYVQSFVILALVAHIGMFSMWLAKPFFDNGTEGFSLKTLFGIFGLTLFSVFLINEGFIFIGVIFLIVTLLSLVINIGVSLSKIFSIRLKIMKKKRRKKDGN